MDLLHEIGEEICLFAPFEPGDIQFMTQHVTYHGRTAFKDAPGRHTRVVAYLAVHAIQPSAA